jgi:hypothetical protein
MIMYIELEWFISLFQRWKNGRKNEGKEKGKNKEMRYVYGIWCMALHEIPNAAGPAKKFPAFYWIRKLIYPVRKSQSLIPTPIQTNPVHTVTSYSFKINFNTILPSTPRSPKLYFFLQIFRLIFRTHFSTSARVLHYLPLHPRFSIS